MSVLYISLVTFGVHLKYIILRTSLENSISSMYIEFDIFQKTLPNLLEFLGLNFSGTKKTTTTTTTNLRGGFFGVWEHIE